MNISIYKWLIVSLLVAVSVSLWLTTSSVFSIALHLIAKSDYSWNILPRMASIQLSLINLAWFIISTYIGFVLKLFASVKEMMLGLFFVSLWVLALAIAVSLTDQFLSSIGVLSIFILVLEIVIGGVLMSFFIKPSKFNAFIIYKQLYLGFILLSWQATIKVVLLYLYKYGHLETW